MDLLTGLLTRRSVRTYDPNQKVSKDIIDQILNAAMYAPSAMNQQPWEFIVVGKVPQLEKIRDNHPYAAFVKDAGTAILVCADVEQAFQEYGPTDVTLAAQNIMLAAHAFGLGTCLCGVYPESERMSVFSKIFKLPEHIIPVALIAIGYSAEVPNQPESRYIAGKVHHNTW